MLLHQKWSTPWSQRDTGFLRHAQSYMAAMIVAGAAMFGGGHGCCAWSRSNFGNFILFSGFWWPLGSLPFRTAGIVSFCNKQRAVGSPSRSLFWWECPWMPFHVGSCYDLYELAFLGTSSLVSSHQSLDETPVTSQSWITPASNMIIPTPPLPTPKLTSVVCHMGTSVLLLFQ